jgi:hypothetical protein
MNNTDETVAPALTPEDATVALTLIDVSVRQLGVQIMQMPGGFLALDTVCKKLEQIQGLGRKV